MYRDHWDTFYSVPHPDLQAPSSFARECLNRIAPDSVLFELGCGNGRDALFFARHGLQVIACDQSPVAIALLEEAAGRTNHFSYIPRFLNTEFRHLGDHPQVDVVYSRFTLHAVEAGEADYALGWAATTLKPGGALFIEARSVNGSLYGLGQPAGRDAFIHDGHFRRFIRLEELSQRLQDLGFIITDSVEGQGLAVHGDDDPVVIRIYAEKASGRAEAMATADRLDRPVRPR